MKRTLSVALLMVLLWTLALPALAVPRADAVMQNTVFETDGSCLVTVTLQLRIEDASANIEYPLPAGAADITIGSQQVQTRKAEGLLWVTLPISAPGNHTVQLHYRLSGLLSQKKTDTLVTLPILSGCHYPVEWLEFSVTFPDTLTAQPALESGYYQQNVDEILEYSFDGKTLTGKTKVALKDRETLVMTVTVPKDYFHDAPRRFSTPDVWDLVMFLLIAVSVLYFLLTLMPKFPGRSRCFTPPEGITAGDVGTCLTGYGTDLTMLVLSWAQLGSILIELDRKNRVILHKRMDMGNERSSHEARWFNSLFGQRTMVDADSYHYAKLCRKLAAKSPLRGQLYDRRSGNPQIFRGMCVVVGIVAGLQMGLGIGDSAGIKTLLGMVFALLCGAFSYFIQAGGKCLPLREKTPLWTALGCGVVWIALGLLTRELHQALPMVIFQFAAGIGAAYGGKRSEMGLRYLSQIRGLRRHMTTTANFDMQQMLQQNSNYFYELAPFALALGVDRSFARRFGKLPLPEESYLVCEHAREMTASKWAARLRKAADVLNQRQKRLPYEQLRGK